MIKIGTVGTGFVVDTFIDAVSRNPDMEVAAVYSRTREKADGFADKHSIEKRYTDADAFLNDAELDFVYIASPNSLHFDWTKRALNAGRNVLCEKPFVSTLRQARELSGIAREKGLFLFEAITVPHLPNFAQIKGRLGDIGQIKLAQLNFSQYSSRYDAFMQGKKPNVFNPEFSGGSLMDINYYNLYFAYGLFGEPKEIKYYPNTADNGIDTSGVLVLTYDGFVCSAVGAKDSRSDNGVQIQGDAGYICMPKESSRCVSFNVVTGGGKEVDTVNVQSDDNAIYYELADFSEIYLAKDFGERDRLLDMSLAVTGLVEKARLDAGIVFPADKE